MNFCDSHRLPRAQVDPIDDGGARSLISSVLATPRQPESFIVFLDEQRRGSMIVNVSGTESTDAIHEVAELAAAVATSCGFAAVVLASVRPDGPDELADAERWLDIDAELACVGVELLEWYVFGREITLPRALLGEPNRWAA